MVSRDRALINSQQADSLEMRPSSVEELSDVTAFAGSWLSLLPEVMQSPNGRRGDWDDAPGWQDETEVDALHLERCC